MCLFFRIVNPIEDNKTVINNMFNVPEVESPIEKKKMSTQKKELTKPDKKTVQIHTLTSKINKTKLVGKFLPLKS